MWGLENSNGLFSLNLVWTAGWTSKDGSLLLSLASILSHDRDIHCNKSLLLKQRTSHETAHSIVIPCMFDPLLRNHANVSK